MVTEGVRLAKEAASAACDSLMRFAERGFATREKDDGSLVTDADLASEKAILAVLSRATFDAGVLTEEQGVVATHGKTRWIVDPLDGTHRFTRGHRFWGPLIALEHEGRTIAASMAMPTVDEVYWAGEGEGAYCNGKRLSVSSVSRWRDALLCLGSVPRLLECPCAGALLALSGSCEYVIAGGDLSGAALVFSGRAEAWVETGVKRWDLAPMTLFVEEAGGRATDLTGSPLFGPGESMLISNGRVHDHVLETLQRTVAH